MLVVLRNGTAIRGELTTASSNHGLVFTSAVITGAMPEGVTPEDIESAGGKVTVPRDSILFLLES